MLDGFQTSGNSPTCQKKRQKTVKVVMIDAQFPELNSNACHQHGEGQASTARAAGARAFANLLRQPKLKAKRFTTFTTTVTIRTIREEQD